MTSPNLAEDVEVHALPNGLRIFLLEKHDVPAVSVQVWYQTGSVQEEDGRRGVAHLFEHLMFRGSEHFGPEEHARLIHDVGGECNAYTAEHVTVYFQALPSEHLELALRLEADRMGGLRLDPKVLDTEREVVIEEFHRYLNNPFARAFIEFRKRLYVCHPYHWTPLGDLEHLQRLSVEDCLAFYRTHYAPNHAALILTGDFRPRDALALVEKHFEPLAASPASLRAYEMEGPQAGPQRFAMTLPVEVPVLALAFRIPEAQHPDIPALSVLDAVLASGRSARLGENLVKKRPVSVHTGGHLLVNRDPGLYITYAAYLPSRREVTVVRAIQNEIRRIQEEAITEAELQGAKNRLLSQKIFQHYSMESLAGEIGWAEFIEGDYRRRDTLRERLEAVSAIQVQRAAQTYLTGDRMTVLSVRPEKFRLTYWLAGLFYSLRG
ncbi:MAG: insulinase family protein [Planctomycetes bacterium]|nr:insulinase family protein [Planctomycetota bacterium]